MELIDIDSFNKWFDYFKKNRHIAFVVFDKNDSAYIESVIRRAQDYFACYYESVMVVSKDTLNPNSDFGIVRIDVNSLTACEEELEILCRFQRTFSFFNNVYFAYSKGFDDDNYDSLIKDNTKLQEEFPAQVMLDMSELPDKGYVGNTRCIKRIDWNNNYEWTSQDYLEYDSLVEYANEKIENLIERQEISFGETIYLYGSSKLTEEIIKQFDKDFHFVIADMNKDKVGLRDDGIEVVDARETLYLKKIEEKILVTVLDCKNVCQELVNVGYEFPKQVKPIRYKKDYLDISCDEVLKGVDGQLVKWKEAYEKIRLSYPTEYLFINPHVSGDIYLSCLYIFGYIRDNDIGDYVYLVSSMSSKKVAELFGIDAVIWDKGKLFDIVSWGRYKGFEETKIKKMHPYIGEQRGLWHYVMDIDYNTMMQKWLFKAPNRITSYDIRQEDSDYIFEKYNLKKGKTVLISPYSHSVAQMDLSLFNYITNVLIDNGYSVCTNIAGEEKALPNTVGLCLPYINCVDFLNKAGYFIGARSGFCDVISTTTARMVVLYRSGSYKHFSIREMGLKTKDILEFCIDIESEKDIVEKTIDYFN